MIQNYIDRFDNYDQINQKVMYFEKCECITVKDIRILDNANSKYHVQIVYELDCEKYNQDHKN